MVLAGGQSGESVGGSTCVLLPCQDTALSAPWAPAKPEQQNQKKRKILLWTGIDLGQIWKGKIKENYCPTS